MGVTIVAPGNRGEGVAGRMATTRAAGPQLRPGRPAGRRSRDRLGDFGGALYAAVKRPDILHIQAIGHAMTTHADHRIWRDVYRPTTPAGEVYLKLTVIDDVVIVSFKEL